MPMSDSLEVRQFPGFLAPNTGEQLKFFDLAVLHDGLLDPTTELENRGLYTGYYQVDSNDSNCNSCNIGECETVRHDKRQCVLKLFRNDSSAEF